jgi:RNA polymerase sigma-70 factor (ECF subfamily)
MTGPAPLDVDDLLGHAAWVRRLALGIVADAADADDVLQETFVAAIERPPRAGVPLAPWLARVARNAALKLRRSRRRREAREAAVARPESVAPDESLARAEAYRAVVEAVVALDAPYREVVLLRYFDGVETAEIAARLGLPVETVRTRLKRAHAALRERLGCEGRDRRAVLALVLSGTRRRPPPTIRATRIAGAAAAAGGALVLKKIAVAAAVVLLVAGGYVAATAARHASPAVAPRTGADSAAASEPPRTRATAPAPETAAAPAPPAADGPRIRGRVVDAGGAPVAGATVVAVPSFTGLVSRPAGRATSARAGADGSFDVAVDDVTPSFRVAADAPRHAPAVLDDVRPGDAVTLALGAGASLTGRVRDLANAPVAGARVRWTASLGTGAALVRSATSDADGSYRIDDLPPGRARFPVADFTASDFSVVAEAEGFARLVVHPPGGDRFPPVLDLWMGHGATVTGVVVDGETGAPIAGARVACAELGSRFAAGGTDGLVANARHWVADGETTSSADGTFRFEHVQAEGAFRLAQNPGGMSGAIVGVVVASAPGYADASDDVLVVPDGTRVGTRIRLWPAARIEGRVVGAGGEPEAGAGVWAFATDIHAWLPHVDLPGWTRDTWTTDADGRYRFDAFPARRGDPVAVRVSATRAGETNNVGENQSSVNARARAGETTTVPDLVLGGPGGDNAAVRVRVLDAAGRPVWGAAASWTQWMTESVTGRDGRLRFVFTYNRAGIPPRPQRLVIRAPGFAPAATPEFTPSKESTPEVTVTLGAAHRVSGRVVREDGTPVAGAQVLAGNANLPRETFAGGVVAGDMQAVPGGMPPLVSYGTARTEADGSFTVGDLPEGPYWIAASSADAPRVVVGPAATDSGGVVATVRNSPPPAAGAALEATVVDAETRVPVTSAVVRLQSESGGDFLNEVPWEERGFTLHRWTGVRDGTWRIDASAQGFLPASRTVTVRDGTAAAVEIGLSRGATVRGTLTAPAGFRPEDCWVGLAAADRPEIHSGAAARPDADGRFAIGGVPPGRWRAVVRRANTPLPVVCPVRDLDVEVADGVRDATLDVRVVFGGTLGVTFRRGGGYVSAVVRAEIRDGSGRVVAVCAMDQPIGGTSFELPPGEYAVDVTPAGGTKLTQPAAVVAGQNATLAFELP